ncbi:MAG: glycosyltransferase [Aquirufa sp.]|jgi:UDP:flavonoid glycosyltransferase YjiC (YdhE family)
MGSRGDVQPFISLSIGLMKRGYDVSIIGPENFKEFVEGFNVDFRPISTDAEKSLQTPEILKLLKTGNILKFIRHINKISSFNAPQLNKEIVEHTFDCDFLLTSSLTSVMVYCIGEKYNKKVGVVFLSMLLTPTSEFPHSILGSINLYWLNRFTYILNSLLWLSLKKSTTDFRKSLGLPYKNMMRYYFDSNLLTIYPVSKFLFNQPKDWSSNTHITGFLSLPNIERINHVMEQMPIGLEEWLNQGEKPVYIGFGSIPIPDPDKMMSIITEILKTTNYRIVFCIGWSVIPNLPKHPNLFVVSHINHEWLLPQCKVGVIHGGIGTTASVIKSKIPAVIVSVLADQPYNGKMIEKNKIGFHIPFSKITTKRLIEGIEKSQQEEIIQNSILLGEKINKEDGLNECLELIELYFN